MARARDWAISAAPTHEQHSLIEWPLTDLTGHIPAIMWRPDSYYHVSLLPPNTYLWSLFILSSLRAKAQVRARLERAYLTQSSNACTLHPLPRTCRRKSYDSASPLVHYKGLWADTYSRCFVGSSSRRTRVQGAIVSLTFTGTGIEWFGSTSVCHGVMDMYIDGKLV